MTTEHRPHSIQDDFASVREAMSRYNGRGSYEERRLWFEEGTFALQRIEEQHQRYEEALHQIKDNAHIRNIWHVAKTALGEVDA